MVKTLPALVTLFVFQFFQPPTSASAELDLSYLQPQDLDFYLLTVDLGKPLYTRFGHTILRVVDRKYGGETLYNWGVFDFRDPLFAVKFLRGDLDYKLKTMDIHQVFYTYKHEQRSLWQNKLFLSDGQKKILVKRLIWNLQPENINYRYKYFLDNCSTKIRDYLDEALGGVLKPYFTQRFSPRVYRDWVRGNLNAPPVTAWFLDIAMNSDIDRPLNLWGEMFLPIRLLESLESLPAVDDTGQFMQGTHLLGSRVTLLQSESHPGSNWNFYHFVCLFFGVPLTWVMAFFLHNRKNHQPSSYYGIFAALLIIWSLVSGAIGIIMAVSWGWSYHTDTHHNANLLFFWPIDWFYLPLGLKILMRRQRLRIPKVYLLMSWVHLAFIVIAVSLWAAGATTQDLSRVATFMVPILALLLVGILRLHITENENNLGNSL